MSAGNLQSDGRVTRSRAGSLFQRADLQSPFPCIVFFFFFLFHVSFRTSAHLLLSEHVGFFLS